MPLAMNDRTKMRSYLKLLSLDEFKQFWAKVHRAAPDENAEETYDDFDDPQTRNALTNRLLDYKVQSPETWAYACELARIPTDDQSGLMTAREVALLAREANDIAREANRKSGAAQLASRWSLLVTAIATIAAVASAVIAGLALLSG